MLLLKRVDKYELTKNGQRSIAGVQACDVGGVKYGAFKTN
ncbi:hypothetical protein ACVIW2_001531 [Bradyrhizobium huanghuaihaiense]|uniref:Uncharacterized protein n=1 Tax=Bradyrhizobium huanghuaihaiense TaxID=990078 RepID=A0A562R1Q3_9BRAD|nr:hypothetical protein IQ16_06632 [Bradyrhizobium huanghuaihaiense]